MGNYMILPRNQETWFTYGISHNLWQTISHSDRPKISFHVLIFGKVHDIMLTKKILVSTGEIWIRRELLLPYCYPFFNNVRAVPRDSIVERYSVES